MSKRAWITLLLLGAGIAGVVVGRLLQAPPVPAKQITLEAGTWLEPPRPMPAFSLRDQDGKPAGPEVLRGHWTLVFFGFTHCPEACPTTLALLGSVRRSLAADLPPGQLPRILLVSVDPERDTPGVLKSWLAGFGPEFGGLTGEPEAVQAFASALGVPFRKIPMGNDYMMDHSTAIMLVSPAGQLAALFAGPHAADALERDLRRILAAR